MDNLINANVLSLSKNELLKRASKYVFSNNINMNDGAAHLASKNTAYGLAKMHYAQASLGFESNACFIATPDQTITRNEYRFQFGSSYGGKYVFGNNNSNIIFPDLKPNSCGILVGGMNEIPCEQDIIKNVSNLRMDESSLDNIAIKWDFEKSNHFIDVFKKKLIKPNANNSEYESQFQKAHSLIEDFDYFFMIHSSAPEYKKISPGMYIDMSQELIDMCEKIETPFGIINVLIDSNAKKYFEFCKKANDFSIKRRELAAKKIFNEFSVINNNNHQGMLKGMNEIILGAQDTSNFNLMPIVLSADSVAYLAMGLPNHSNEQIEELGWTKRAQNRGLLNVLENTNLMPHGGGYHLINISSVHDSFEIGKKRYFSLSQKHSDANITITNPDQLEFRYREKEVAHKTFDLGLAENVAVLAPEFIIKF